MAVIPFFVFLHICLSNSKKTIKAKAEYNAKVQSHLVESINGIETIKGNRLKWNLK